MSVAKRWQDWLSLSLGLWLFFSPFLVGYAGGVEGVSAWNAYIIGIGIVVFAAVALNRPALWEEWIGLALGAWLVVSPWILGYSGDSSALRSALVVGLIVAADALWVMTRTPLYAARH